MKKLIYEPKDQESSIVPPTEDELRLFQEDEPQKPYLTEADLPFFINTPPPSPSAPSSTSTSFLSLGTSATAQDSEMDSQPSVPEGTPSQMVTSDSPQQGQHECTEAKHELLKHAEAKVDAQAIAQGTAPRPDWGSTPTDAPPVSNLGSATAAGKAAAGHTDQLENQSPSDNGFRPKDWHAANVVPEGVMLPPEQGAIGAPLLQTPTQLPVFALDVLLWPNQIMMLRQVVLWPANTFE